MSSKDMRDIARAIASKPKEAARPEYAKVVRIDGDTAYVHFDGGADETPATMNMQADVGDTVTVWRVGGKCIISGNSSAPADVARPLARAAMTSAETAQATADGAAATAASAATVSDSALTAAQEAADVAGATAQHFFDDDDGIHVTEADDETWEASHTGKNILVNSLGILLRNALNNLVSITSSAISFFDGNGNAASNIVAQFGSSSATIGKSGGSHSTIDSSGQRFYASDGTTQLADIGYGEANDDGTVSNAPHYYFGAATDVDDVPDFDSTVKYTAGDTVAYDGKLYMAWSNVIPIGDSPDDTSYWQLCPGRYAHVEGEDCMVSDKAGHAEGHGTRVGGAYGHAEGLHTIANGGASHAEGQRCLSYGHYSHTQNTGNIAMGDHQTAIGKWNDNNSSNALEIGNGTSDSARSNALTVDWNGNVECGMVNGIDVGSIGSYYNAAWSATSSAANNVQLTAKTSALTAGTYLVEVQYPVLSASTFTAELKGAAESNRYILGGNYTHAMWVVTVNANAQLYLASAQSSSCTFSYTARGWLRATRLK